MSKLNGYSRTPRYLLKITQNFTTSISKWPKLNGYLSISRWPKNRSDLTPNFKIWLEWWHNATKTTLTNDVLIHDHEEDDADRVTMFGTQIWHEMVAFIDCSNGGEQCNSDRTRLVSSMVDLVWLKLGVDNRWVVSWTKMMRQLWWYCWLVERWPTWWGDWKVTMKEESDKDSVRGGSTCI